MVENQFQVRRILKDVGLSDVVTKPRKRLADAVADLITYAGRTSPEGELVVEDERGMSRLVVTANVSGEKWKVKTFAGASKAALARLRGTCIEPLGRDA